MSTRLCWLVSPEIRALTQTMTCNVSHPMRLGHPVITDCFGAVHMYIHIYIYVLTDICIYIYAGTHSGGLGVASDGGKTSALKGLLSWFGHKRKLDHV